VRKLGSSREGKSYLLFRANVRCFIKSIHQRRCHSNGKIKKAVDGKSEKRMEEGGEK
jgi:hypothetical protein